MDKNLGYFAKHVAQQLGTSPNTLRRWALELEKVGYEFQRNNKGKDGHRIFYQHDINALRMFRDLVDQLQDYGEAAKLVVDRIEEGDNDKLTPSVNDENDHLQPVKITFTEQELKQYTAGIIEETSQRVATETAEIIYKRMENLLEQRDHQLLNQLNEGMEQRRLETATSQEEGTSWFKRLFGGKK